MDVVRERTRHHAISAFLHACLAIDMITSWTACTERIACTHRHQKVHHIHFAISGANPYSNSSQLLAPTDNSDCARGGCKLLRLIYGLVSRCLKVLVLVLR